MITPFPWIPDTGAHVGRISWFPNPCLLYLALYREHLADFWSQKVPAFPPYSVLSTAPFYRTFSQFVKKVTRAKFRFNDHRSIFSTQIHHSASRRVETDKDPKANISHPLFHPFLCTKSFLNRIFSFTTKLLSLLNGVLVVGCFYDEHIPYTPKTLSFLSAYTID